MRLHIDRSTASRTALRARSILRPDLLLSPTLMAAAALFVAAFLATPPPAHADDATNMLVFGKAGAYKAADNLNASGTADFKTGFNVGGGLEYDLE